MIWGVAIGVVVLVLGVWEVVLRSAGFPAEATPEVWSIARARAAGGVPVLVGSSRMQADIDLDVWVEVTGGARPAQLASAGGPALPYLEDLAADEGVTGLVVVDAMPFHTFDRGGPSGDLLPGFFAHYERFVSSPAVWAETYLRRWVSTAMVWRTPAASWSSLRQAQSNGTELLFPPRSYMRADRFRPIDWGPTVERVPWTAEEGHEDPEAIRAFVENFGKPADPNETAETIARLEAAARTIRNRGGEVVFVAFPSCGPRKREEQALYPREEYWDRLAAATSFRTIHSDDYPELRDWPCYDGSHLDQDDAAQFTRRFLEILGGG